MGRAKNTGFIFPNFAAMKLIQPADYEGEEWAEWMALSPAERWRRTEQLWAIYLALGGSLDPEPDPQSPFFDEQSWRESATDGRPGLAYYSARRSLVRIRTSLFYFVRAGKLGKAGSRTGRFAGKTCLRAAARNRVFAARSWRSFPLRASRLRWNARGCDGENARRRTVSNFMGETHNF